MRQFENLCAVVLFLECFSADRDFTAQDEEQVLVVVAWLVDDLVGFVELDFDMLNQLIDFGRAELKPEDVVLHPVEAFTECSELLEIAGFTVSVLWVGVQQLDQLLQLLFVIVNMLNWLLLLNALNAIKVKVSFHELFNVSFFEGEFLHLHDGLDELFFLLLSFAEFFEDHGVQVCLFP